MDLVQIYQCFCDLTRLRILHLLTKSPLCVCHFQDILREPQVKISKHLAYLRRRGMVVATRDKNWMIYSLSTKRASLCHFAPVACMTLLLRHNLFMLNMAETENNVEQRYAVRFTFGEGESASNVNIRLHKVYGEHCMNRAQVFDDLSELKLEEQASTANRAMTDH